MSHVSSIELRKVRPEAINEKSVLESVAGLLQEVVDKVPQAYAITSRPSNPEQFESIEWMRFLPNGHEWHPSIRSDTLVLLIAYKTGLSLWTIETNGIANELFSIREHNLTSVCLLINNNNTNSIQDDPHSSQRPLFAFAKSAGPPSVQIRSLKNDQQSLKIITLPGIGQQSEPLWIESNKNVLICATHTFLIGYDLLKFDEKFFISNCYSSIPYTLSTRWLAFADSRLSLIHQSAGGINGTISEQYVSYTGAVFNAAKSSFKSMVKIGESVFGYGTNNSQMNNSNLNDKTLGNQQQQQMQLGTSPTSGSANSNPGRRRHGSGKEEVQPGIVTIVDTVKLFGSTIHDEKQNWIIAHFQAHADPIGYLQFNPTGHLLVTCDQSGHYFNVLEIKASPYRCTRTYIKHLYTLFRGDTDCRVSHMTFSYDSRWLAVSTKRGTTHLYAINPYGGVANVGTHTTPHVVNKPPRFNRNMGYDELPVRSSNPSNTENNSKDSSSSTSYLSQSPSNSTTNYNMNSSRTKRANTECVYTTATTLIRQPTESFVSGISAPFNTDSICVASSFGASRGFLNPDDMNKQEQTACDSLFIISWHGRLIEYVLEPVADMSKHSARVTNETPITLKANPKAQWFLQKLLTWSEVRTSTGYSFLSQGHRPTSANKVHSKDDWLRQIDIVTQMGPHRRLWMGPQFHFKHYKDTTGSVCLPDSNSVLVDESPREDMNRFDDNLTSLPIEHSKSIPLHVPDANNKDVARAFIEVGSFNSHDSPLLSIYGTSQDNSRSADLVDRLADAANETPFKYSIDDDTTDSLASSSGSGTIVRPLQTNHSIENMSAFPDPAD